MRSTSRHLSQCQKRQVTRNTSAWDFTVTSARHTGRVHPVGHQSLLACHRLWIWAFPRDSTASSNLTSFRGTQSHMVETPTRVSCPAGRSIFHTFPRPRPDAWLPSGPPPLPLPPPPNFAAVWYFVMASAMLAVTLTFPTTSRPLCTAARSPCGRTSRNHCGRSSLCSCGQRTP